MNPNTSPLMTPLATETHTSHTSKVSYLLYVSLRNQQYA